MMRALINVEYTNDKYWCDSDIRNEVVSFDTKKELKSKIETLMQEKDCVVNKKLRFKKMFIDIDGASKHCGYYCTATIEILDDYRWKKISFDAWIEVTLLSDLFLGDI